MLSREVAIYRALIEKGIAVRFISYGGKDDALLAKAFPEIELMYRRWNLPIDLYVKTMGMGLEMKGAQIFKSNQMNGAEIGLTWAKKRGAKFIARSGYLHSLNTERSHGFDSIKAREARALERYVYAGADQIVVTTAEMRQTLRERYEIDKERIHIIPNYVQTDVFAQIEGKKKDKARVVFVGRLSQEKNLDLLIQAMEGSEAELFIAGEGYLRPALEAQAGSSNANVRFLGAVPNSRLPELLNSAEVFILPSKYEGHPKALLEAMACQMAVIGSNVSGIREIIRHKQNGLLCEEDPASIRERIDELLDKEKLRAKLGQVARQDILKHFSLKKVSQLEHELLLDMARK